MIARMASMSWFGNWSRRSRSERWREIVAKWVLKEAEAEYGGTSEGNAGFSGKCFSLGTFGLRFIVVEVLFDVKNRIV